MLQLPVPALYAMRQGQPFIVQTRLEWLALERNSLMSGIRTAVPGARSCPTNQKTGLGKILNYVATEDWVVAIFAKAFQTFEALFGIGSAGYDGFDEHRQEMRHPDLHEAKFIVGTHEAGIREAHWNDIARFIVKGKPPTNDDPRDAPPEWRAVQPRILRLTSSGSPALLVAWAILGALFMWSLAVIAWAAWLPVLYCVEFTSSSRDSDLHDGG